MRGELQSAASRHIIREIRESVKETIASLEEKKGPVRYLTVLNLPIPLPGKQNLEPILRRLDKQLEKREAAKRKKTELKEKEDAEQSAKRRHTMLEGRLSVGRIGSYSIEGKDFFVDEHTWVIGTISVGVYAKVKCKQGASGVLRAVSISLTDEQLH